MAGFLRAYVGKLGEKGNFSFVKVINNFKSSTLPLPSLPCSHPAASSSSHPRETGFPVSSAKTKPKSPAARSQEEVVRDVLYIIPWQGLMDSWSEPQQDLLIPNPLYLLPSSGRDHVPQEVFDPGLALGVIKQGLSGKSLSPSPSIVLGGS